MSLVLAGPNFSSQAGSAAQDRSEAVLSAT